MQIRYSAGNKVRERDIMQTLKGREGELSAYSMLTSSLGGRKLRSWRGQLIRRTL